MGRFGKWIGGGLGWVMGGPIGGMLGFLVGSLVDGTSTETSSTYERRTGTTPGAFGVSLLVLIAAVMKADGKVVKSERIMLKSIQRQFESTAEASIMLRDILKQNTFEILPSDFGHMDYSPDCSLCISSSAYEPTVIYSRNRLLSKDSRIHRNSDSDYISIRNMFIRNGFCLQNT